MAKLIFSGEKFGGRVYELVVERTTVGRGEHNTLTLQDASVSQAHCEILVNGTEVIVRDLGSSNGTFVNGARLHEQQRPLLAGQLVRFGSVEARLELESSSVSDTDTVTDVTAVFSHARHQRDRQRDAPPAGPAAVKLTGDRAVRPDDQTLALPRPAPALEKSTPPATTETTGKVSSKFALALIVAAVVIGLAAICWLLLAGNR